LEWDVERQKESEEKNKQKRGHKLVMQFLLENQPKNNHFKYYLQKYFLNNDYICSIVRKD
jgi:hypothetical protein